MGTQLDLRRREWLAVCTIIVLMALFANWSLRAPASRWPKSQGVPLCRPEEQVVMRIRGAVHLPGRYHFPVGTTVEQALLVAGPLPEADTSRLDLEQPLKHGQSLVIPKKKKKKLPERKLSG